MLQSEDLKGKVSSKTESIGGTPRYYRTLGVQNTINQQPDDNIGQIQANSSALIEFDRPIAFIEEPSQVAIMIHVHDW